MTDEYLKGIQAKADATTNPTPPTGKAMTAGQCVSALRAFDVGDPSTWPEAAVIEAALVHIDAQVAEIEALKTELATAREHVRRVYEDALPKFNWGKSALDAKALKTLNEFGIYAEGIVGPEPRALKGQTP